MERDRCWGWHTFEVEIVILSHVGDVECAPDVLSMRILIIRDVLVVELGEERLLGWQVVVIELFHAVHVLVRVEALPHE